MYLDRLRYLDIFIEDRTKRSKNIDALVLVLKVTFNACTTHIIVIETEL